jgi:hypothetical protein
MKLRGRLKTLIKRIISIIIMKLTKDMSCLDVILPIEKALENGNLNKVEEICDAYLTFLKKENIENPENFLVNDINYYCRNNKDWINISKKYIK